MWYLRFKFLAEQIERSAMARHRCDISSKRAVLPGRTGAEMAQWPNDAEMAPANSLRASTYCSEFNKKFDFDIFSVTQRILFWNVALASESIIY